MTMAKLTICNGPCITSEPAIFSMWRALIANVGVIDIGNSDSLMDDAVLVDIGPCYAFGAVNIGSKLDIGSAQVEQRRNECCCAEL